jgi:hypothetical protein
MKKAGGRFHLTAARQIIARHRRAESGLPQVPERIIGQVQYEPTDEDAEYIDDPAGASERNSEDHVEQEQQEEQTGDPHGTEAQPLFHEDPFHPNHDNNL